MATLRQLRELALLSPEELAAKIGVSRSAIGYWERGETRPTMKHIRLLVVALNKTPEEILQAIEESSKELAPAS